MTAKLEKYAFLNNIENIDMEHIEDYTRKPREYKLWYEGDIDAILTYYKSGRDMYGKSTYSYTPSFMKLVPTGSSNNIGGAMQSNNFTVYHNPVANIISRAMSNLLFSTAPKIRINDGEHPYNELVESIIEENNLYTLMQEAAEMESYSGSVAFKPVLDPDFSDYPLVQVYPKEDFLVNKKYGKVISIVFMDNIYDDDDKFILFSEYGRGFVKYKLYNSTDNQDIPLEELSATRGLKDLYFVDKDTNKIIDTLTAIYKVNRPGGRSDYENSIDDFNAIDEAYSNMMNYIRKTSPKRVLSESMLKKNDKQETIVPTTYDSDLIIRWDNTSDVGGGKETNEIQTTGDINNAIQGYLSTIQEVLKNTARTVGLSIKTLSGEDLSGANASADALSIRENIDLRTRDNKLIGWEEAIIDLVELLILLTNMKVVKNTIYVSKDDDIDINVEFYNPATPTFEQISREVNDLLNSGLIDHKGALERLWVDTGIKSQEEVDKMYDRLMGNNSTEDSMIQDELDNEMEIDIEEGDTDDES